MNRRKYIAGLLSLVFSVLIVGSLAVKPAYAATTGFLMQDSTGKYFEYDYDELLDSAVQNAMKFPAPLYDDYLSKTLVAFHDNINGYVSQEAVVNASVIAAMNKELFSIDQGGYTESQEAKNNVIQGISAVQKLTVKNGEVVPADGTGEDTSDDFDVVDIY